MARGKSQLPGKQGSERRALPSLCSLLRRREQRAFPESQHDCPAEALAGNAESRSDCYNSPLKYISERQVFLSKTTTSSKLGVGSAKQENPGNRGRRKPPQLFGQDGHRNCRHGRCLRRLGSTWRQAVHQRRRVPGPRLHFPSRPGPAPGPATPELELVRPALCPLPYH